MRMGKGMVHGGSTAELQVLLTREFSANSLNAIGILTGSSNANTSNGSSSNGAQGSMLSSARDKSGSPRLRYSEATSSPIPAVSPAIASLATASTASQSLPFAQPGAPSAWLLSTSSAVLYGTVGLAMGFINKAVLQQWPFSNSLLMFQMAASVAIIYLASVLRLVETRPLTVRAALSLWGVVFFYNANVAFALAAVQALSIPVYHVLKRLTPVMILMTKTAMGEPLPPTQVTLAVCTVVAGCFLSGAGDLSFDLNGYACAIVSCILQSAYLIMVERSGNEKGFTSSELMVYNAVLSLPILMLLTLLTGEAFLSVPALVDLAVASPVFLWVFVVSLVAGVLLNYALFLCTLCNTALTTTIVGALRSVLGTILGFFLLGGVKATPWLILGCVTNTLGGIWYTVAKMRHKLSNATAAASAASRPQKDAQQELSDQRPPRAPGSAEETVPLKSEGP